jgi:hypothetical protein
METIILRVLVFVVAWCAVGFCVMATYLCDITHGVSAALERKHGRPPRRIFRAVAIAGLSLENCWQWPFAILAWGRMP